MRFKVVGNILKKVIDRIGKGTEHQHFFVALIDRVIQLVFDECFEVLQFGIMLWCYTRHLFENSFRHKNIGFQILFPSAGIHVGKFYPYLTAHAHFVILPIVVVGIQINVIQLSGFCKTVTTIFLKSNNLFNGKFIRFNEFIECNTEGIY